ncbi:hypothetical protein NM688_g9084 [Phlebia brevispora]|uniref:Uncharacterized protein n=1 Tax=Phlebia brevispora TaxID=194682 RepID=A0ACC1RLI0_9APHY|nr:hypothetical protein NM688_g9084 [Phlebia brevispora]
MGHSLSKASHSDPREFASPKDASQWREYDYIVVGGGTAGCILAARLSEDRNTTVLLIEAGKSEDFITKIPFAFVKTFKSPIDWAFKTTPQSALNNRVISWPRGKVLGGTSAINASIYHQCAPEDFEEWERLGATGWNYSAVRPYFLKSETYHPSPLYPGVDVKERGTSGPIQTGHHRENAPISGTVFETVKALGVPYTDDVNTPKGTAGVVHFISTIDQSGRRSSTAAAYLTPDVFSRPNLTIAVNTHVDQVLFETTESKDPVAIGVQVSTSPTSPQYRVRAKREVILSGGAVGSPQLLLLSGIGPADELSKLGIPVVKDLPATGKNLSDVRTFSTSAAAP